MSDAGKDRLRRAWSVDNVLNAKFKGLELTGSFREAIGVPEIGKSWAIWGHSGSGKTTFNFQLAREISSLEDVYYNSREEGLSKSIQNAYRRSGITGGSGIMLINEPFEEMVKRLRRRGSPKVLFLDSIPYIRISWNKYIDFCSEFDDKIKIWVGHATGKEPKGALADAIRYDSPVKIYTEGYRAFVTSRYNETGKGVIDIWPVGAQEYWAETK